MSSAWTPRYLASIADFDRAGWDRLFGPASEGFDYYLACERAAPPMFTFAALGVLDGETLVAGAPAFRGDLRLDMMLEGRSRALATRVGSRFPRLRDLKIMGAGSPHADELATAFDPDLSTEQRCRALEGLLGALQDQAAPGGHRHDLPEERQRSRQRLGARGVAAAGAMRAWRRCRLPRSQSRIRRRPTSRACPPTCAATCGAR